MTPEFQFRMAAKFTRATSAMISYQMHQAQTVFDAIQTSQKAMIAPFMLATYRAERAAKPASKPAAKPVVTQKPTAAQATSDAIKTAAPAKAKAPSKVVVAAARAARVFCRAPGTIKMRHRR